MTRHRTVLLPAIAMLWMLLASDRIARADSLPAAAIPAASLIQPAELAAVLLGKATSKPLILQVGFRTLYEQAHIPGAEYVGAASDADGLRALRKRVAHLPRDTAVVIYCGCCPWTRCPNMAAAYEALHALGFTQLKGLHIANDFGRDWVDKGYPVARNP